MCSHVQRGNEFKLNLSFSIYLSMATTPDRTISQGL